MANLTDRNDTNRVTTHEAFGLKDSKGRELGVMVTACDSEFVPKPEGRCWGYEKAVGHYFAACVQTTRDGKRWGASQNFPCFDTTEERDAYVARRVAQARKGAAKLAAKGA